MLSMCLENRLLATTLVMGGHGKKGDKAQSMGRSLLARPPFLSQWRSSGGMCGASMTPRNTER